MPYKIRKVRNQSCYRVYKPKTKTKKQKYLQNVLHWKMPKVKYVFNRS